MNIAHIIPHSISFPLATHNGRYDWLHQLAIRQAAQGHNVTVYGSPDSSIKGVRTAGILQSVGETRQNNIDTFRLALSNTHDVYHSHFDNLHYELAQETEKPIIFTQHWWPTDETVQIAKTFSPKNVWAVPPTEYMYEYDKTVGIQTKSSIYHGIDLNKFHPSKVEKTDRLLFVGRISPEKNLDLAIKAAKKAHATLDIIGKIAPKNQQYWQSLQPLIDNKSIRYLGVKNTDELIDYYTSARGILFPTDINEAFGLVAVEAQACGTPVIMKRGGSRGELIQDRVTGFLCRDENDFVEAVNSLGTIKSDDCIAFAGKFDILKMTHQYDQLYDTLIRS